MGTFPGGERAPSYPVHFTTLITRTGPRLTKVLGSGVIKCVEVSCLQ